MHTILMIHTECACVEWGLPEFRNQTFKILLEGSLYGIRENYTLILENVKGAWYFVQSEKYSLKKKGCPYKDMALQDGDIWEFCSGQEERISIIVVHAPKELQVFQKYILTNSARITFGKNPDNTIQYDFFHLVSGFHGVLEKRKDGIWVEDYSTNGMFCQGERFYGRKKLNVGEEITMFGLHILLLEDILCICGIKEVGVREQLIPWKGQISRKRERREPKEGENFSPAPRTMPVCDRDPIYLQLSWDLEGRAEFQKKRFTRLSFLGHRMERIKQRRGKLEEQERMFQLELDKVRKRYQDHVNILTDGYPSAAECCGYGRESIALWNRNFGQEDFFFIRLGLGEKTFDVDIRGYGEANWQQRLEKEKETFAKLFRVPVGISLKSPLLWGIVGDRGKEGAYSVAYGILAQILASYCYTDVKVGIIYDENRRQEQKRWEFAKWFPHIWSGDGKQRYLAGNQKEANQLFYAWNQRLKKEEDGTRFVLFLVGPELLQPEQRKKYFTLCKSGLSVFLLVENFRDLPNECEYIIENSKDFQGVYHTKKGQGGRKKIEFDRVSCVELTDFSKRLADIQLAGDRQGGDLPEQLGFLEMYQARSVCDLKIPDRWRRSDTSQSIAARIGKQRDGSLCYLDAQEKQDGSHGLLAGTTGSGKSEVLLTYLLSLAVNFSPKEIAFVLIDFKGGGMANFLKNLPHTAGCITNLSGSQVKRAMLAIKSENKRRQKLFARYQVNHISEYTYLWRHGRDMEAIPHLFLVVDEFAELKSHTPDFLQELIHVAQVGRSLGLHLILSTQKPKGTVDENIWSNSQFRLCLRVQTKEDSMEVLRRADASYLTGSGQGYLQVGNQERYTKFQAAYTGTTYRPEQERDAAILLNKSGAKELLSQSLTGKYEENRQTELGAVIDYICHEKMLEEFGRAKPLWLPPLSEYVFLEEIFKEQEKGDSSISLCTVIGLCDAPGEQRQFPYEVDFLEKGNYAVLGGVQTGKTTVVETLLMGLMSKYTPRELHLYLLDFNSKRLHVFAGAKQVGGVINTGEEDKLERFFVLLDNLMMERRELLKDGNFQAYRQMGKELPAILVVLDDMENFREQTKDVWLDKIYHMMRDSGSLGIYFFFTAAGFGIRGIPGYFREGIKECLALALSDRVQYQDTLRRNGISFIPERKKGRGLVVQQEEVLELQVALPLKEVNDYKRNQSLKNVVAYLWSGWSRCLPRKIPTLPKNLCLCELDKNTQFQKLLEHENKILIGYDKTGAKPYFVSIDELDGYMVSGKRKTGKKNFLTLLSILGKRKGIECIFFAKKGSELANCRQWVDGFVEEEREWLTCLSQIKEAPRRQRFLLVEDIKDFFVRIETRGRAEITWLSELIAEGRKKEMHWIFAMNPEDYLTLMQFEVFSTIVEKERGIHLGGQLKEQKLFHYENFSYKEEMVALPAGTGIVADKKQPRNGKTILTIQSLFR